MDCAIYARISRDVLGTQLGVNRQLEDCRLAAEARGWKVVAEYVDNDISAYSGKARPGYEAMIAAVKAGDVRGILAWNGDRLHRTPAELEDFISVVEGRKVAVGVVAQGDLDLTTSDGRAMARVVGTFARLESERKAERLRRKHEELAQRGAVSGGGARPFGFDADRVTISPTEAALVREGVDRLLQGDSIRGIARDWNVRGITTTTGGTWSQHPLRRLLTSARIAGRREHFVRQRVDGKEQRILHCEVDASWPGIIDRATLEEVRRIVRDPGRRTNIEARSYLLTGFLRCGTCGRALSARPRADKVRRYICAKRPGSEGCGTAILAEPAEQLMVEAVLDRLDSPALARAVDDDGEVESRELLDQLNEDEATIATLAQDFYVDRIIGRDEYLAARGPLEARIEATKSRLLARRGASSVHGVAGVARATWPTLSFDRQRAVMAALVDKIVIGPGRRGYNRFDPERISPEWLA